MGKRRDKMARKYCYTATTVDKYELPIAVADTVQELAVILGTSENNIRSSLSRYKGKHCPKRYHAVQI